MRSVVVKVVLLIVVALTVSYSSTKADDFSWQQASGPPEKKDFYACAALGNCVDFTCHNVNVALNINGQNVVIKSYLGGIAYAHGNCEMRDYPGACYEYPENGVKCAKVEVHTQNGCNTFLADVYVYRGTCTP